MNKNFLDQPTHEIVRAIGQATVQLGLFLIAISTIMKQLGALPDTPVAATIPSGQPPSSLTNRGRGYFD